MPRQTLVVALAVVALLSGCGRSGSSSPGVSAVRPYQSLEELEREGVPIGRFSATAWRLREDGVIEFDYYTYGKSEDLQLIEPAIEEARQITSALRQQYPVELVFFDGNPTMVINGERVGTGEVVRRMSLERVEKAE